MWPISRLLRRYSVMFIAMFAFLFGVGDLAISHATSGSNDIFVCVNKKSGVLRQITKGKCQKTERVLRLSSAASALAVVGAQGPNGATGAQGPAGAQGPPGLQGSAGATGAQGPVGIAGPAGAMGPARQWGYLGSGNYASLTEIWEAECDPNLLRSGMRIAAPSGYSVLATVTLDSDPGGQEVFFTTSTAMSAVGGLKSGNALWRLEILPDASTNSNLLLIEYLIRVQFSNNQCFYSYWGI